MKKMNPAVGALLPIALFAFSACQEGPVTAPEGATPQSGTPPVATDNAQEEVERSTVPSEQNGDTSQILENGAAQFSNGGSFGAVVPVMEGWQGTDEGLNPPESSPGLAIPSELGRSVPPTVNDNVQEMN